MTEAYRDKCHYDFFPVFNLLNICMNHGNRDDDNRDIYEINPLPVGIINNKLAERRIKNCKTHYNPPFLLRKSGKQYRLKVS